MIGALTPATVTCTPCNVVGNGACLAATTPLTPSPSPTPKIVPVLPGAHPGWKLAPFTNPRLETEGTRPTTLRLKLTVRLTAVATIVTGPSALPARTVVEARP